MGEEYIEPEDALFELFIDMNCDFKDGDVKVFRYGHPWNENGILVGICIAHCVVDNMTFRKDDSIISVELEKINSTFREMKEWQEKYGFENKIKLYTSTDDCPCCS